MKNSDVSPHPVDIHVGQRIRLRRKMCGRSQHDLGKSVGVTFQQVQKYERGTNRVGASRLYELSQALEVDISYFFEGYDDTEEHSNASPSSHNTDNLDNRETYKLIKAYYNISDISVRKKMLNLITVLAKTDTPEGGDI